MKQLPLEIDGDEYRLVQVAWYVQRLMRAEAERRQATPGLTLTQLRALGVLHALPGASLATVASELAVQSPAASKAIDELVQRGLVDREVVSGNRRKHALHVTSSGTKALRKAATSALTGITKALSGLTPKERATVDRATVLLYPLLREASIGDGAAPNAA